MSRSPTIAAAAVALPLLAATACFEATEPSHVQVITLTGSPYERGLQHGKAFENKIRSLYTTLLSSSLLPYLNRELPDIETVLTEYQAPLYQDGQFSYQLMLQSGQNLAKDIPQEYLDEMHGIADGANLPFEQILILNTFLDTMLGFRAITFFIRQLQSPYIRSIAFSGADADGADNNGDGSADEPGEGVIVPYEPSPHATMAEVPVDAKITMVFEDQGLGTEPEGVDPKTIRIQLDDTQYVAGDGAITMQEDIDPNGAKRLNVTFAPPGGFTPAAVHAILVQAGDLAQVVKPPPAHARLMRDERIVFTTKGYGKKPHEVDNRGAADGRTQPPSLSFAVRGAATPAGVPLLAHHFALLDSNISHKHTAIYIIKPTGGTPHAVVGWTGLVWGFSGMNVDGLAYTVNSSDSLDSPMVKQFADSFLKAKLVSTGIPIGIIGREMLSRNRTVDEAAAYIGSVPRTFGWNVTLADAAGGIAAVETDANILSAPDGGVFAITPDASIPGNLDQWGRPWCSVGADDIRMAAHYRKNADDIVTRVIAYNVRPQRYWTTFYYRSMRAWSILGGEIADRYGTIDLQGAIEILKNPALVDQRDSMNAVVYRPAEGKFNYAMGEVPATSVPFVELDLKAAVDGGGK